MQRQLPRPVSSVRQGPHPRASSTRRSGTAALPAWFVGVPDSLMERNPPVKLSTAATQGVLLGLLAAGGIASAIPTTATAAPATAPVDARSDPSSSGSVDGIISLTALGIDVHSDVEASAPTPRRCGYSAQGMDAHYRNCSGRFVLVRADWDNGRHYTTCVGPWGEQGLYHDGTHRQIGARAVPQPPTLITTPSGRQICASSQPDFP